MNEIENRIVNLQFNNKDFERNAAKSMRTVDELKKKLDFSGVKNTFDGVIGAFKYIGSAASNAVNGAKRLASGFKDLATSATHPIKSVEQLTGTVGTSEQAFSKFSAVIDQVTIGALRRLGEQALQTGERFAKSLTVDQLSAGWEKFGEKTRSVASIMSATGMSSEKVADKLKKLNWYTDETSYAYTDMTNNIGKFTNAGIELDDAITAMIGIGNAAGLAGSSVQDASHAMEGFSGAMAQGYMDRQRWSWIKTAHMDTVQFKQALIDAAEAQGILEKGADGLYAAYGNWDEDYIVSIDNFENAMTKAKWLTRDVMTSALKVFGGRTEEIYAFMQAHPEIEYTSEAIEAIGISVDDLGLKAFKASQEARTFADAIDSVKDAISTGFMTAIEHLIGNYDRAKKLWTDLANNLWDIFADPISRLNDALDEWEEAGGQDLLNSALYKFMDTFGEYVEAFKQGIRDVFGELDSDRIMKITEWIDRLGTTFEKSLTDGTLDDVIDLWTNFLSLIKRSIEYVADLKKTFGPLFTGAFRSAARTLNYIVDGIHSFLDVIDDVRGTVEDVVDTVEDVIYMAEAVEESIESVGETAEDVVDTVAKAFEAIAAIWTKGTYGNGAARKAALSAIGLDPDYVQDWINRLARGEFKSLDELKEAMIGTSETVEEIADGAGESVVETANKTVDDVEKSFDAIKQIWNLGNLGTGAKRKSNLEAMCLDPEYVQDYINKLARGEYKSLEELREAMLKDTAVEESVEDVTESIEELDEAVEEVSETTSGLFSRLEGLGYGIGNIFSKIAQYINADDQVGRIIKGVKSVVTIAKTAIDQIINAMANDTLIENVTRSLIDPVAFIADKITEIAEGKDLYKVKAIISQISAFVTAISNIGREISKSFMEGSGSLFGKNNPFSLISKVLLELIEGANRVYYILKSNDRLTRIMKGLMSAIRLVANVVNKLFKIVKPGVNNLLPSVIEFIAQIADIITQIADNDSVIEGIANVISISIMTVTAKLKAFIKILETVVKVIVAVVSYVVGLAKAIYEKFGASSAFSKIIESFARLSNAIAGLFNRDNGANTVQELADAGKEAEDAYSWLDGIVAIVEGIAGAFSSLIDGIASVIEKVDEFIDKIQNGSVVEDNGTKGEKKGIFASIAYGLSHIFDSVDQEEVEKGASKMSASVLAGVGDAIGSFFKEANITYEKLGLLGKLVGLLLTLVQLNSLMKNANTLTKTIKTFPLKMTGLDWLNDLKDILSNTKGLLSEVKTSVQKLTAMNMLQTFVASLIGVALTVAMLAEIPEAKLAKGVTYLGLIATIIAVFAKVMSKLNPSLTTINKTSNSNNTTKTLNFLSGNKTDVNAGPVGVAAVLVALASFALSIAGAIAIIDKVRSSGGDVDTAVRVLSWFLGLTTLFFIAVAEFGKKLKNYSETTTKWGTNKKSGPGGYFTQIAVFMMAFSSGLLILVGAIAALSYIDSKGGDIVKAFHVLGGVFLLMAAAMALVMLLVKNLKTFKSVFGSNKNWVGAGSENKTISGPAKGMEKMLLAVAASMIIIAAAIDIVVGGVLALAYAFKDVKTNNLSDILAVIVPFIVVVAALVGSFAAVVDWVTEYHINPNDLLKVVAALAGVALAIDLLIPMVAIMAAIEGFGAQHGMEAASVAVAGSIGVMLLAMAVVVIALGEAAKRIPATSVKKIVMFGNLMLKMALTFTIIGGVAAGIVYVMKRYGSSISDFVAVAATIVAAISVLIGAAIVFFYVLNRLPNVRVSAISEFENLILTFAAVFAIIGGVLALMQHFNVDWDAATKYLQSFMWAFGIFAVALTVVFAAAIGILEKVVPGSGKALADYVKGFGTIFLALAALFAVAALSLALGALALGGAVKLLSENLPSLTKALPEFGAALDAFCQNIKDDMWTLIGGSVALGILIVAAAAAIAVLIWAFDSIYKLYDALEDDQKKKMTSIARTVAGVMITIGAAVLSATPEMIKYVEEALKYVASWLGEIIPNVVNTLLLFVFKVFDGLIDAIGNSSQAFAYYLLRIVTSIFSSAGKMLAESEFIKRNFLSMILQSLFGMDESIADEWAKDLSAALSLGPIHIGAAKLLGDEDTTRKWFKDKDKETKEALKKITGFDPDEQVDKPNLSLVNALGFDNTSVTDVENAAYNAGSAAVKAAGAGISDGAKEQWSKISGKIEGWDSVKDLISKGLEKGGTIDMSEVLKSVTNEADAEQALGMIGLSGLQVDNFDISAWSSQYSDALQNYQISTDGTLSNITGDWGDFGQYMSAIQGDLIGGFDNLPYNIEKNLEEIKDTSENATQDTDTTLQGMIETLASFEKPFYTAGELLVQALQDGMLGQFEELRKKYVEEIAGMLRDATYVYTGEWDDSYSKRAEEVQKLNETPEERQASAAQATADSMKAQAEASRQHYEWVKSVGTEKAAQLQAENDAYEEARRNAREQRSEINSELEKTSQMIEKMSSGVLPLVEQYRNYLDAQYKETQAWKDSENYWTAYEEARRNARNPEYLPKSRLQSDYWSPVISDSDWANYAVKLTSNKYVNSAMSDSFLSDPIGFINSKMTEVSSLLASETGKQVDQATIAALNQTKFDDSDIRNRLDTMNSKLDTLNTTMESSGNTRLYLDTGVLVGEVDRQMGRMSNRNNRGGGR